MNRFRPTPEALSLIREWRKPRLDGRRPRPYAKEVCAKLGIGETTLRKVARQVVRNG